MIKNHFKIVIFCNKINKIRFNNNKNNKIHHFHLDLKSNFHQDHKIKFR